MSPLSASDAAKLAILVGAFVGVYGLSRWASRQTESVPPSPDSRPEPARAAMLDPSPQWSKIIPIDARSQFARTGAVDEEALRPIRIANMYFSRFDIVPGPPDPTSFADEIFVDLYDENSDHKWTSSYFVTTPLGLDQMLEEEHWQYAFADRVFFVRRYDAQIIRQMIVEHLIATQERPTPPQEQDRFV
jgi:hypothetical protein